MSQRRLLSRLLTRPLAAVVTVAGALVATAAPAATAPAWPEEIVLDDGYRPEGVAPAGGTMLYVGSIPTGAVSLVDVRTGTVDPFVPAQAGRAAIGVEQAGDLLFVAGGPTGNAYVYDARTGEDVATIPLTTATPRFVNDVVVAGGGAWFTDSRSRTLHRVDLQTLEVSTLLVDITLTDGNNLNGIEASPDARTLYSIQSSTGTLFAVDAATGDAEPIVTGLVNGDGLLRDDALLYVVQNRRNQVAVVDLETNAVVGTITSPLFHVPTTIARIGSRLYLPNAKFGEADMDSIPYEVVSVLRP